MFIIGPELADYTGISYVWGDITFTQVIQDDEPLTDPEDKPISLGVSPPSFEVSINFTNRPDQWDFWYIQGSQGNVIDIHHLTLQGQLFVEELKLKPLRQVDGEVLDFQVDIQGKFYSSSRQETAVSFTPISGLLSL